MWLKDLYDEGRALTSREYPDSRERDSLLNAVLEDVLHLPRYAVLVDPFNEIGERECSRFLDCARRLAAGEPLQYIVGWTEFYGRRFNVTPAVLIPRPETEQLCREAIERICAVFSDRVAPAHVSPAGESNSAAGTGSSSSVRRRWESLRILDLCTGSGCIAWTLALELPGSDVVGVDISPAALDVALNQGLLPETSQESAKHGGQECLTKQPKFVEYDILRGPDEFIYHNEFDAFDVIISNPPYVRDGERPLIRRNVLEHEPSLALFVTDSNPLKFYKAIRDWAERLLVPGGLLFLEQNEALAEETATICCNFSEVETVSDYFGKPRFTVARK